PRAGCHSHRCHRRPVECAPVGRARCSLGGLRERRHSGPDRALVAGVTPKPRFVGTFESGIDKMYRIVHGSTHNLPDVAGFIRTLETLSEHQLPEARELFDKRTELFVARAPGRLDVMGGIADYSGSLVLELPISEADCGALHSDESA